MMEREGKMAAPSVPKKPTEDHHGKDYPARVQSMRSTTALILCLVLLTTVAVGGGITAHFQRENIRRSELLRREGVATMAKVIALETSSTAEGVSHYVTYTYISGQGSAEEREITREDVVQYYNYSRFTGGRIEVIYARSDPEIVQFTFEYHPGFVNPMPALIGAAVVLPGLAALFWYSIRYRRAVRLEQQGLTVMVEVLDLWEQPGDGSSYYAAYQLPGGTPFRHKISYSVYKRLRVGDRVAVRYLPDQPRLFRLAVENGPPRQAPAEEMVKAGKRRPPSVEADRKTVGDAKWIPEDPSKQWTCPKCSQSNPNNTFKCEKCGYSLV
jgi:hypothetical protein